MPTYAKYPLLGSSGGSGSGDVNGGSLSIDGEVVVYSGTGGKTIKQANGTDADNKLTLDFSRAGEALWLTGDVDGAITLLIENKNSGPSARAIVSLGNDTGVNKFSIQANSSGFASFPDRAVWASHFTNGSALINSNNHAPLKLVQGTTSIAQVEGANDGGTSGTFSISGLSASNKVKFNPNAIKYVEALVDFNNTTVFELRNPNAGALAYTEMDIVSDGGTFFFGAAGSNTTNAWIEPSQAYLLSQMNRGMVIGTIPAIADLKIIVGGTTPTQELMRFKAQNQLVNMPKIPDYANNAAAIAAGLVAGDIYQNAGVLMIVF